MLSVDGAVTASRYMLGYGAVCSLRRENNTPQYRPAMVQGRAKRTLALILFHSWILSF